MMSAAATDIIVKIIHKIIDNIDKTVDANKNTTLNRSCCSTTSYDNTIYYKRTTTQKYFITIPLSYNKIYQ